jgi:hypothetical protein
VSKVKRLAKTVLLPILSGKKWVKLHQSLPIAAIQRASLALCPSSPESKRCNRKRKAYLVKHPVQNSNKQKSIKRNWQARGLRNAIPDEIGSLIGLKEL